MMTIAIAALILGIAAGMRSFLPLAVLAWASRASWLPVDGTMFSWAASLWAVVPLTLLALGELAGDKHPSTPSRLTPPPLVFRFISGGLCGALLSVWQPGPTWLVPAIIGATGAMAGAFGGHRLRTWLAREFRSDLVAALIEDAVALCLSILALFAACTAFAEPMTHTITVDLPAPSRQ